MMQDAKILSAHSVSIGYSRKNATQLIASDVNVDLYAGKLVALIGANGIGKSTLLRTLIGIQKPLAGEILLDGKQLATYSALELAQQISVVLTEKLPASNLSVYELVALGRQPYTNWIGKLSKEDLSAIETAIEQTQIQSLLTKKHYEISDGQLQKVLIARALAQSTPIIILDEPTTHLDLMHKSALFQLLRSLASKQSKCILFSTHDIEMALQLADEIIIMSNGKVVQDTPQNIIAGGYLHTLFDDRTILFDADSARFVFKNL